MFKSLITVGLLLIAGLTAAPEAKSCGTHFSTEYYPLKTQCEHQRHYFCGLQDMGPDMIHIFLEDGSVWEVVVTDVDRMMADGVPNEEVFEEVRSWQKCDWILFEPAKKCYSQGVDLIAQNQCSEGCVSVPLRFVDSPVYDIQAALQITMMDFRPSGAINMELSDGSSWYIPPGHKPGVEQWISGDRIFRDVFVDVDFSVGSVLLIEKAVIANTSAFMREMRESAVIVLR